MKLLKDIQISKTESKSAGLKRPAIILAVLSALFILELLWISGCSDANSKEYPVGIFKAIIGDEVIFTNGPDVVDVCTDPKCAVIRGCRFENQSLYSCDFTFSVTLSNEAAQRLAIAKKNLESFDHGLSKNIVYTLNDRKIKSLIINPAIKGKLLKDIFIVMSAKGSTMQEAVHNTTEMAHELQSVFLYYKK